MYQYSTVAWKKIIIKFGIFPFMKVLKVSAERKTAVMPKQKGVF